VRQEFEALLDRADELMPEAEPEGGWDSLTVKIRTWIYWRRSRDWSDPSALFDALAEVRHTKRKLTQKKWASTGLGKKEAKDLQDAIHEFGAPGSQAAELVEQWWAYRYPVVMSIAKRGADAFAAERKERGQLNFQDLLVLTADLLRAEPTTRLDLGKGRRLFVDEFQDTDPLQAEIILLLASNPGSSQAGAEGLDLGSGTGEDWRDVIPRPGALFVVGDPKQSIYRFRRADIALYEFVKTRFEAFGACLTLEANFRSLPAIEQLVEGVFNLEDAFPATSSDRQAAFAPLRTNRMDGAGVVATYAVEGATHAEVAVDDAQKIAACIARRVNEVQDREPGHFMVLTRNRKHLSVYARALEDHGLPVDVSGAGVGFEDELAGLLLLLRCLADPENRVRVLGAITGPFFGVTLDAVVRFKESGGSFSISRRPEGEGEVEDALATLHDWWQLARREPADLALERIVSDVGLFPLAASGTLGQLRAGALVYVLDAVRARTVGGDPSIHGAVDAIETALAWDDAEAPLVPGRLGAVRVMNLHRAKGLEAEVVFLAAPFGDKARVPTKRIARDSDGRARGSLVVAESAGWGQTVIARPVGWPEDEDIEREFEVAEKVRLLYVAATRAKDELWVARGAELPRARSHPSPWLAVEEWLDEVGAPNVGLEATPAPAVPTLESPSGIQEEVALARTTRDAARGPTYALETVSAIAKVYAGADLDDSRGAVSEDPDDFASVDGFSVPAPSPSTRGYEWGSVVHAALAAANDGLDGDALKQICRQLLVEFDRPVDSRGEPSELVELVSLVRAVRESEIWKRAEASEVRYAEMPFAVNRSEPGGGADVVEGVIDLVFKSAEGWVVADYKTDQGDDPDFERRQHQYRAQVDLYATSWEQATGEPVAERALVFTSLGLTERW
ncbi:MAG: UvrD-helicase domain-containing protein, partial [Longimicrobiales bacterium]